MIHQITGISSIRMLYVQLHYQCNFSCRHCFHGDLLNATDRYSPDEVTAMMRYFRREYDLRAVTLLGGEPLLYPDIRAVCASATELGLGVDLCTNGHFGFRRTVTAIAPHLAKLRISLDGLRENHDRMRRQGSFGSALKTIDLCRQLGVTTGATMTVTAHNIGDVLPLARLLESRGVTELKLHCLRMVGNAIDHPDLEITAPERYARLHEELSTARLSIAVVYDSDLSAGPHPATCEAGKPNDHQADRIEADPRGALTMSCKAVGLHASAFRWDKASQTVAYRPHDRDELQQEIPQVLYQTA